MYVCVFHVYVCFVCVAHACVCMCVMFIAVLRGGIPPGITFSRSSINTTLGKL